MGKGHPSETALLPFISTFCWAHRVSALEHCDLGLGLRGDREFMNMQFCIFCCCRILLLLRNMFQQTLRLIHQLYSEILFTNFFSTKVSILHSSNRIKISQKSLFLNPILQVDAPGWAHCRLKNWKIALPCSLALMHLIINFWWS